MFPCEDGSNKQEGLVVPRLHRLPTTSARRSGCGRELRRPKTPSTSQQCGSRLSRRRIFFLRHLEMPRTILEHFRRFHSPSSRGTSRSAVCPFVDASSRQENDIGDRRVKSQNLLRHSEVEQLGLRRTAPAPPVEKGHAARDVRRVRDCSGGGSAKGTMVQVARVRTHVHDLCLVGHSDAAATRRECVELHRCMYERDIPMRHEVLVKEAEQRDPELQQVLPSWGSMGTKGNSHKGFQLRHPHCWTCSSAEVEEARLSAPKYWQERAQ